jgi:hypothetical protein
VRRYAVSSMYRTRYGAQRRFSSFIPIKQTWNHRNHLPTLKIMILYTYVFFAVMLILPGLHTDTYSAHTCKAPSVHLICWPSWPSPKIYQNRKIVLWPWIPWTKNKEVRQQKRTNQKAQRVFDAVLSLHLHGKWMQVHWRWYSVTVSEKNKNTI